MSFELSLKVTDASFLPLWVWKIADASHYNRSVVFTNSTSSGHNSLWFRWIRAYFTLPTLQDVNVVHTHESAADSFIARLTAHSIVCVVKPSLTFDGDKSKIWSKSWHQSKNSRCVRFLRLLRETLFSSLFWSRARNPTAKWALTHFVFHDRS